MSRCRIEETPQLNSRGERIRHLTIDNVIWMSNDDIEYTDIDRALITAKGDCYIGGLGLGSIATECIKLPRVTSVTVVEIDKEIIDLVSPIIDRRIKIIHGDARYEFCESYYDWMYWDIWLEPTQSAYELMLECFNNGSKWLKANGAVEAWLRPRLENKDFWE